MKHSRCIKCAMEIHRDDWICTTPGHSHPVRDQWGNLLNGWYDEQGNLCRTFPRGQHIPEEEDSRVHALWADSDTVTVKELRDAEKKQRSALCGVEDLLKIIDESREPEYPVNSVWKAKDGMIWLRVADDGGRWSCFGSAGTFSHNAPERPLKRMDVI